VRTRWAWTVLVEVARRRRNCSGRWPLRTRLVGINNRDLRTFEVSLQTTLGPARPQVPADRHAGHRERHPRAPRTSALMRAAGVHAFLVGEAFMRAPEPGQALAGLFAD
jgi:indole-3-glycerol phosphate synthase